ncbi:MAG TPA: TonB-dependent receptor [Gemmatimonadales bacterium]|nr:TonB-dependent receptor [Gemmatimonadales bacterium]
MPVRIRWLVAMLIASPAVGQAQQRDSSHAAALEEIIVTAERRPSRASDAAAAVRVLGKRDLSRRAVTDLTTLLRDLPGVQIEPVVGSGAGVALQGLGSDRVLVLVDGAPVVGRLGGQFDLTRLSPAQLERVEIVEGPQSTLYGSAALGGVINLLTRRDLGPGVEASTQFGSLGQRDYRLRVTGPALGLHGAVDLGRRSADLVPGRAAGSVGTADRWDGMLRVTSPLGGGALDLRVLGVVENQEYLAASRSGPPSNNFNDNWQLDALTTATLGTEGRTELRLHGSLYDHRFIRSTSGGREGGAAEWDKQRVVDLEAVRRGDLGRHRWLVGAKVEREWLSTGRIEGGERAAWSGAVYVSADWRVLPWLTATTGARLTSGEVWGTDLAPRLGLVARGPAETYLKLAAARGFRAPSFKELYTNFTNPGHPSYTVLGNPDLAPEYSWNATAEIGRSAGGVEVYLRGYRNWLRGLIETELVDPSRSVFAYRNVDRARTAGLEVGASATRGIVTVRGSHAYLDSEDGSTGLPLLNRAAHMTRGAVTVEPGRLSLTGEAIHTTSVPLTRNDAGEPTQVQDAYTRINLSTGVALGAGGRLTLGVDNVADTRPANAPTYLGRRWYGGLTWGIAW